MLHWKIAAGTVRHSELALNGVTSRAIFFYQLGPLQRIGFPSLQTFFVMSCLLLIFLF